MAVESEKERLYRGMTPGQIAAHEDWIRRMKAERAAEEQRLIEEAIARRVKLAGMTDLQVMEAMLDAAAIMQWDTVEKDPELALQIIQNAGFTRQDCRPALAQASECLRDAVKVIVEMIPNLAYPQPSGSIKQLNDLLMEAAKVLGSIEIESAR